MNARTACVRRHVAHSQTELHVADDVTMREERVVLEHQSDVAFVGRSARKILTTEANLTAVDRLKPGDGTEQRGLPTARRPEQCHSAAVVHFQRHVRQHITIAETDRHRVELQHQNSPTEPTRSRSISSTTTTVNSIKIVDSAIAAPKFSGPGWPRNR